VVKRNMNLGEEDKAKTWCGQKRGKKLARRYTERKTAD
jgi:hypothetical protein